VPVGACPKPEDCRLLPELEDTKGPFVMQLKRKLRPSSRRTSMKPVMCCVAITIGTVSGTMATVAVGQKVAMAAPVAQCGANGDNPLPPHFCNGNVEMIRGNGSELLLQTMQKIGDLYTDAGVLGCEVNSSPGETLYNSSDPASAATNYGYYCVPNDGTTDGVDNTDVVDNWDRTEVLEGITHAGSANAQAELCGSLSTPLPVDFARSGLPPDGACSTMVEAGYAKDAVPIISYPVNPTAFGTSTTAPYSGLNGGVVGPVSDGWLPGDPNDGPYSGTALTNISNADNGGGASSTAYRIWCASGSTRISDWGALTNLGPDIVIPSASVVAGTNTVTLASPVFASVASGQSITGPDIPSGTTISGVGSGGTSLTLSNKITGTNANENPKVDIGTTLAEGDGAPIGVPIRPVGVDTTSDTEAIFAGYAESGVASGGCSSNMNTNAPSDPNSATISGSNTTPHIAPEDDAPVIGQFATADFPDAVDQAIEVATSLYVESNGVYNTNPYLAATSIDGTSYSGVKVEENGNSPTTATLLTNRYATAHTLFNIYNSNTVRASAGGFLNWVCDSNANFEKGTDESTGLNLDSEVTTTVSTTFGFPRLTDETAAPTITTPADNIAAPNNSCAASLMVNTTAGSDQITLTAGGDFPIDIPNAGGLVGGGNVGVSNAYFPSGTTVVSGAGTSTLTLSNNAMNNETGVPTVFAGVPAVTSVASPQN
jgi:hypothetical protein